MGAESRGCRPAAYSRRHPEQSVLYRIVQRHLETYLMLAREGDWDCHAVPAYVGSGLQQERSNAVRMHRKMLVSALAVKSPILILCR